MQTLDQKLGMQIEHGQYLHATALGLNSPHFAQTFYFVHLQ